MKSVLAVLFLASIPVFAAETSDIVRFVRVRAIEEKDSNPPSLELTYDLACNQTFLKVVRHEDKIGNKNKRLIYLGVLVREDPLKTCLKQPTKATASAELGVAGKYVASKIEL